jgi:hypothetical protein
MSLFSLNRSNVYATPRTSSPSPTIHANTFRSTLFTIQNLPIIVTESEIPNKTNNNRTASSLEQLAQLEKSELPIKGCFINNSMLSLNITPAEEQ